MHTAPWQLMACETVIKTVNEFEFVTRTLRPIGGCIRAADARTGLRSGDEVWAADDGGDAIRIAWEWTEIQPNVVALFDPMNIICNVSLVDGQGHALGRSKRMLCLNNLVHRLGWREMIGWPFNRRFTALSA